MAWTNMGFPQNESPNSHQHPDDMNGKIIIVSLIIIVIIITIIVAFHVSACLFRRRRRTSTSWHHNHSSHETPPTRGLDKAIVDSMPTFTYTTQPDRDGGDVVSTEACSTGVVECAVCLIEFQDNDACRLLPKCNHSFHTECIDMWFLSNITCPMCRTSAQVVGSVTAQLAEISAACPCPCEGIDEHRQMSNLSPTDYLLPHQSSNNDIQRPRLSSKAYMLLHEDINNHAQRSRLNSLLGGEHVRGMLVRTCSSRVDARYDIVGEEMHNIDSMRRMMHNYGSRRICTKERDRSYSSHACQEALFRHLCLPNWRRSASDRFLNMRQGVQFPSNILFWGNYSHVNSCLNTDHWQVGGRSLPHIIIDVHRKTAFVLLSLR